MPDRHPSRVAAAFKMFAATAVLLLVIAAGLLYWALPAATGYASHYLCVRALAGGDGDARALFAREVKPINPLFNFVTYRIDRARQTVEAAGVLRSTVALYRPGLGCTIAPAGAIDACARRAAASRCRLPRPMPATSTTTATPTMSRRPIRCRR